MPDYGSIIVARAPSPRERSALEINNTALAPPCLDFAPLLLDSSDAEGRYSGPSWHRARDLERGGRDRTAAYLAHAREMLHLVLMLVAIPMAYLTLTGVPVAVGACMSFAMWEVLRVVVPVSLALNVLFCAIFCAMLWGGQDVGDAVWNAVCLFGKTVGGRGGDVGCWSGGVCGFAGERWGRVLRLLFEGLGGLVATGTREGTIIVLHWFLKRDVRYRGFRVGLFVLECVTQGT